MQQIKAIETEYKGFLFRSRLEARWGVFLDALGIPWDYEAEGYALGSAGYYLPDFKLLDRHEFLEIKPADPLPNEKRKAQALAEQSGWNVTILYGRISTPLLQQDIGMKWPGVEDSTYHGMTFFGNFNEVTESEFYFLGYESLPDWIRGHEGWESPDFDGTLECARELRRIDHEIQKARTDAKAGRYVEQTSYGVYQDQRYWTFLDGIYRLRRDDYSTGGWCSGQLAYAYEKAQRARFEHGATP